MKSRGKQAAQPRKPKSLRVQWPSVMLLCPSCAKAVRAATKDVATKDGRCRNPSVIHGGESLAVFLCTRCLFTHVTLNRIKSPKWKALADDFRQRELAAKRGSCATCERISNGTVFGKVEPKKKAARFTARAVDGPTDEHHALVDRAHAKKAAR